MSGSTKDLDALVRRASRIAEQQFKKCDGEIVAFWLVENADGEQGIIGVPRMPKDGADKDKLAANLSEIFQEEGVRRCVAVLPMWFGSSRDCRPSEDPDRKEGVMFFAEDDRGARHGMREIIRSSAGARLGKLEFFDKPPFGRFVGLLSAARSGATVQ